MRNKNFDRRGFLWKAAGATVAVSAGALAASLPATAFADDGAQESGQAVPKEKVGIQLYSVRDKVSQLGFAAVLVELARIGYKEIEFAGYTSPASPGITPEQIRALLDDNGLKAVGSHVGLNAFRTDLQRQLDIAEILGTKYVGTANAPTSDNTVAGYQSAAAEFNTIGAAAKERGLRFYQHNHAGEFAFATDDPSQRLYDIFLAGTDPSLVYLEMDIYWAYVGQYRFGGFDPVDYVRSAAQRYPLFHVKDGKSNEANANGYDIVEFGAGNLPYKDFFRRIGTKAKHTEIWEQDTAPSTLPNPPGSFGAADRSFDALVALLAKCGGGHQ